MVTDAPVDPTLDARYSVEEEIGRGGYGAVYRARQRATGQYVAVKMVPEQPRHARAWERFGREARLCGALHHPHIVRLIDAHQGEATAWLVFEWVPGRDLAQVLAREGRLEPAAAVRLMGQVLDALAAAHALGIVHRDIKPANIMIARTGARQNAQVLDFGIGTLAEGRDTLEFARITGTGDALGTPAYAAPEQLRGEAATQRADIYAWALTFVECVTGERVISARTMPHVLLQQLGPQPIELPPSLRVHRLAPVLRRALHKDPSRRAVTAESLLRALDSLGPAEIAALAPQPKPPTDGVWSEATLAPPTGSRSGEGPGASAEPWQPLTADDRAFLVRVPLMRRLTPTERDRIAEAMHRRALEADEVLVELGEDGVDAFIVRKGELTLELPLEGHEPRVVARMGPGTVVGEVCLVEPAPRTLRIRAAGPAEVLVIDGPRFGALCDADDPGVHKLMRFIALTLCDRLRQTTGRLQSALRGDAPSASADTVTGLVAPIATDRPWDRLKRLFVRSG